DVRGARAASFGHRCRDPRVGLGDSRCAGAAPPLTAGGSRSPGDLSRSGEAHRAQPKAKGPESRLMRLVTRGGSLTPSDCRVEKRQNPWLAPPGFREEVAP